MSDKLPSGGHYIITAQPLSHGLFNAAQAEEWNLRSVYQRTDALDFFTDLIVGKKTFSDIAILFLPMLMHYDKYSYTHPVDMTH